MHALFYDICSDQNLSENKRIYVDFIDTEFNTKII